MSFKKQAGFFILSCDALGCQTTVYAARYGDPAPWPPAAWRTEYHHLNVLHYCPTHASPESRQ